MLRVGLTGGVGSGKSSVAAMLRGLGAQVSLSDEIGRALMQPGGAVFDAIVACFGRAVLSPSGQLNRRELARIAFGDGRLEELNGIVHPAVIAAQSTWMDSVLHSRPHAIAVVESALIFETKHGSTAGPVPWRTRFDRIVVVTAPLKLRRERYLLRLRQSHRRLDVPAASADFAQRVSAQWSDEEKSRLADDVLSNDNSLEELQQKVAELYRGLAAQAAEDEGM